MNKLLQKFINPVSYTHLRAHETVLDLVCRLLLEKKKITKMSKLNSELHLNISNELTIHITTTRQTTETVHHYRPNKESMCCTHNNTSSYQ